MVELDKNRGGWMKAFESFIESDAFFPILVLLLVMLVIVFIWIILSNRHAMIKQNEKRYVAIDENAKIKIVSDSPSKEQTIPEVEEREPSNEISIVEEIKVTENKTEDKEENFEDNNIYQEPENINLANEITEENVDPVEIKKEDYEFPIEDEIINDIIDPFKATPSDNHEVNENVNVEYPKEYTREKTEVFEFPEFKEEEVSEQEIEDEIINTANEYIKNIMGSSKGD